MSVSDRAVRERELDRNERRCRRRMGDQVTFWRMLPFRFWYQDEKQGLALRKLVISVKSQVLLIRDSSNYLLSIKSGWVGWEVIQLESACDIVYANFASVVFLYSYYSQHCTLMLKTLTFWQYKYGIKWSTTACSITQNMFYIFGCSK